MELPDEAFRIISEFQQKYPEDFRQPDILLEQARDYFALGRSTDGLQAWNNFIRLYPEDERIPELTLLLARREKKESQFNQAIEHYRNYLDNYPSRSDRPQVILELAAFEKERGLNLEAYNDLTSFRNEYPNRPEQPQVLLDQANLAAALGRIDDMANLYDIFRSEYPSHQEFSNTFLEQTRFEMAYGRNAAALATLERGIINSPDLDNNKQVQDLLLNLYLDEGRVEDWAGAMEEFLGRDTNPEANLSDRYAKYSQVAQVYQELGRTQDAQKNFDLALANRPSDASGESLYTIASAYKMMGLDEQYKSVLQIIQTLPDPLWQNVANQELNNLG
jgi:tetratricopeptide (TPR) repeat protein